MSRNSFDDYNDAINKLKEAMKEAGMDEKLLDAAEEKRQFNYPETVELFTSKIDAIKREKGEFWGELVQYTASLRLFNVSLNAVHSLQNSKFSGLFIHAVLGDKYGEEAIQDKLKELIGDVEALTETVLGHLTTEAATSK